jgi:hypothetical protein
VLYEFGEDFAILGRQVPIKIDNETHHIDVVENQRGEPPEVLLCHGFHEMETGESGVGLKAPIKTGKG